MPMRFLLRVALACLLVVGCMCIAATWRVRADETRAKTNVAAINATRPVNFALDILPILSKHGCNSGSCHGKAIGQNGFKLSLFGFAPNFDYAAIVHEGRGRRVSPAAPDDSLLLLKASGGMAHGGGVRFERDSESYKLLRAWIEHGLPWGRDEDPRETKLDISPSELTKDIAAEQQLRVIAHYSDGSTRDVTKTTRYDSQNPDLAAVSNEGLVRTTGRAGETQVMVRYSDLVGTVRIVVPWGPALLEEKYASFHPRNFIDELALAKWREIHVAPSSAATEEEFLRRVFIDAMGTLPSPQEVREFAGDTSPDKRDALVDKVLSRGVSRLLGTPAGRSVAESPGRFQRQRQHDCFCQVDSPIAGREQALRQVRARDHYCVGQAQ